MLHTILTSARIGEAPQMIALQTTSPSWIRRGFILFFLKFEEIVWQLSRKNSIFDRFLVLIGAN